MRKFVKYIIMISSLLLISNQVRAAWEVDVKFYPTRKQHLVKIIRWDEDDQTKNILYRCKVEGRCILGIYMYHEGSYDYTDDFLCRKKFPICRRWASWLRYFGSRDIWGKRFGPRYVITHMLITVIILAIIFALGQVLRRWCQYPVAYRIALPLR